jgi:hypothetical protein
MEETASINMKYIALALLLAGCGCSSDTTIDALDPHCNEPCYEGPYTLAGVGVCRLGVWECDSEGRLLGCIGSGHPGQESCDNLDNDCDGQVDENLTKGCSNPCGYGQSKCKEGAWTACDAPQPKPEICDGKDNDCDYKVDEPEDLPLEFCYNGPTGTVGVGECRPGVVFCEYGFKRCTDITPQDEICDFRDNNCDGMVDEGVSRATMLDLVLVWDHSGSMVGHPLYGEWIRGIKEGLLGNRQDLRVAVLKITDLPNDGSVIVHADFQNPAMAVKSFETLLVSDSGGKEASIDAVCQATTLPLTWRQNTRKVFMMFTDEIPQTFSVPGNDLKDCASKATNFGLEVHIWTLLDMYQLWSPIPANPLNSLNPLESTKDAIRNRVLSIIGSGC